MDTRTKLRGLIESMSDEQRQVLAEELHVRSGKVSLEDITPERMRDPKLAAEVRAEVEAALRGER
jgi:hypothetical protein